MNSPPVLPMLLRAMAGRKEREIVAA